MAKKELTQAQRDQKNERLRAARALRKQGKAAVAVVKAKPATSVPPVVTPMYHKPALKVPAKPPRKPGSGGARPNTGFAKKPVAEKMVMLSARVYPHQLEKFGKLGGGEWLRTRIDAGTVKV